MKNTFVFVTYVESSEGNWGAIGTYAINSKNYTSEDNFGVWLDANNFNGVNNNYFYWSSASGGPNYAWGVYMSVGGANTSFDDVRTNGVLVVRGSR